MLIPIYICFILLLISVFVNFRTQNKILLYYILFPALASILLLLLYNNYGADMGAYKSFFSEIVPEIFWERGLDQGYAATMALVKVFGGGFYFFLTLINFVSLVLVFKTFHRFSPYIALSWMIYFVLFFGYNHTILRQGVAIALTLYSFKYILNQNLKLYFVFILLAFLFHSSALLFFPAYWIANSNLSNKYIYILLLISFPLVLIDTSMIIAKIAGLAGINENVVYAYFNSESNEFERAGLSLGLLVRILFYFFFIFRFNREDKIQHAIFNIYSFYLILYFPLSSVSMLSARGLDYYKIFECIMIPFALYNVRNIYIKIGMTFTILMYYIYALPKNFTLKHITEFDSALLWIISSF